MLPPSKLFQALQSNLNCLKVACLFYSLCLQKYSLSEENTTQTSGYLGVFLYILAFCLYAIRSLKKLGITITIFKQHKTFQEGCQWKLSGAHYLTWILDSKGNVFEFLSAKASTLRRNASQIKNLSSFSWVVYALVNIIWVCFWFATSFHIRVVATSLASI